MFRIIWLLIILLIVSIPILIKDAFERFKHFY
jgi:hypothetical protein